jgi:serine/threonine protein kinase/formylglycine-generating enzyme required for sulfatase activity/predicted esterase
MGEVYRARDSRLEREVAVKVLPEALAGNPGARQRFEREARTVAALSHPNILAIYDLGQAGDIAYAVMELLEGETLRQRLESMRLSQRKAVDFALQIARGLAAAHDKSVVHRDLKPENVFVTTDGQVKILDFGLAKVTRPLPAEEGETDAPTLSRRTTPGTVMGTVGYMSPEQVRGREVDHRSDLFAFGAVLYEMLAGRRAFAGESAADTMSAILKEDPPELSAQVPGVAPALDRIVLRCLEKRPDERFQSARDVAFALDALSASSRVATDPSPSERSRSPTESDRPDSRSIPRRLWNRWIAVGGIAAVSILASVLWLSERDARRSRARDELLPEAGRLAERGGYVAAFELARRVERLIPDDPRLAVLWPQISTEIEVRTIPGGADVFSREYGDADGEWQTLGRTPIEALRHPRGYFRWKIVKPGFASLELAAAAGTLELTLREEGEDPPGMVRVPAGAASLLVAGIPGRTELELGEYLIDRFEVSNRDFEQFVASGGYERAEHWDFDFLDGERRLSWTEAMQRFRDSTGRPGPATWELGNYPEGQADLPVTGVSWYEAAAYAAFAGKSLPTIYHWFRAADTDAASHVAPASNFENRGLWRVGRSRAMSAYGSYDMAGNAREWCWNSTGQSGDERYILGGAWHEPSYMFGLVRAQSPFDRSPANGFRCVEYLPGGVAQAAAAEPVPPAFRDYTEEQPVSEEMFRVLKGLYSYDRSELNAIVESETESGSWTIQRISFDAAYGGERVVAYLLLPGETPAPYQTVIYFPGGNAFMARTEEDFRDQLSRVDFLPKSGRALLFPIYQGSYERGSGQPLAIWTVPSSVWRDHVIQWSKDLGRSIDYLETRDDIDREKLAYFGVSRGAAMGAVLPAVESRIKAAVLIVGGFYLARARPEVDQVNFASRVTAPVLMLNARYDFILPVESSQKPMFRLLGTRDEDKRHVVLDIGHEWPPRRRLIRETLDWLDRHLGRVSPRSRR